MSVYLELCDTYDTSYREVNDYLRNLYQSIGFIIDRFQTFLGCPSDRIRFMLDDREASLRDALFFLHGVWNLKIKIKINRETARNDGPAVYYPFNYVYTYWLIEPQNQTHYLVRLQDESESFLIDIDVAGSESTFFALAVAKMKASFLPSCDVPLIKDGTSCLIPEKPSVTTERILK